MSPFDFHRVCSVLAPRSSPSTARTVSPQISPAGALPLPSHLPPSTPLLPSCPQYALSALSSPPLLKRIPTSSCFEDTRQPESTQVYAASSGPSFSPRSLFKNNIRVSLISLFSPIFAWFPSQTADELGVLELDLSILDSQFPLHRLPLLRPTFLAWQMWHRVRVQRAISTRQTIITMDITTITSVICPVVTAAPRLLNPNCYPPQSARLSRGGSRRLTLLARISVLRGEKKRR